MYVYYSVYAVVNDNRNDEKAKSKQEVLESPVKTHGCFIFKSFVINGHLSEAHSVATVFLFFLHFFSCLDVAWYACASAFVSRLTRPIWLIRN